MKAQLISRPIQEHSSFSLACHAYKNFLKVWHYHPEFELVIILESTGTRFVGDSIEKFEAGEIVLIGKDLPHLWLNDKAYFQEGSKLKAKAHVVHFNECFAGNFLNIPEMTDIQNLLQRANRGIKFEGDTNQLIIKKVNKMFGLEGYAKVIKLLKVLKLLSEQKEYRLLSGTGYVNSFKDKNNSKIARIHEYIINNFKNEISLNKAAELAHMNPSAFSRYFRNIQQKTFIQFLNEVRIGYACKLLIEQKYNITEVCYDAGFNNVSNFNRQFKALKGMSPSEFTRMHHSS